MLTYKINASKNRFTLFARLDNKGPWRKTRRAFGDITKANLQLAMLNVLHADDAVAQIDALIAQVKGIKMKVSTEEAVAIMLKEENALTADIALLNGPAKEVPALVLKDGVTIDEASNAIRAAAKAALTPTVDKEIAAKIDKIAHMKIKTSKDCTYTVTGKDDSYHSKIKSGKPGNMYWVAFKNLSQVQSTYASKDELIEKLIIPAFQQSNLRSGNPSASDLRNMVAYLAREGCVTAM